MKITLIKKNFIISISIFFIELLIAIFLKDDFIRPFFGDFLAVIFLFYFLAAFLKTTKIKIAIITLLIAFFLETLQYFQFLTKMNWEKYNILKIILGNVASWEDILAYTLGVLTVLIIENKKIIK